MVVNKEYNSSAVKSRRIMLRLKELKKLYNLTQADLANVLGTKQQQISRYETEERELKASQIIELCKHYNISADWLLGLEEKEK